MPSIALVALVLAVPVTGVGTLSVPVLAVGMRLRLTGTVSARLGLFLMSIGLFLVSVRYAGMKVPVPRTGVTIPVFP